MNFTRVFRWLCIKTVYELCVTKIVSTPEKIFQDNKSRRGFGCPHCLICNGELNEKSILAVAIVAGFTTSVQAASVKVYGRLDAGLASISGTGQMMKPYQA